MGYSIYCRITVTWSSKWNLTTRLKIKIKHTVKRTESARLEQDKYKALLLAECISTRSFNLGIKHSGFMHRQNVCQDYDKMLIFKYF